MAAIKDIRRAVGLVEIMDSNGNIYYDIAEFSVTQGMKTMTYPSSKSFDDISVNVGSNWKGLLKLKGMTIDLLHDWIGGTMTAGTAESVKPNDELKVVPATPFVVTLAHAPLVDTAITNTKLAVFSKAANGDRTYWEEVASGSEATKKYSLSGTTVTFHGDDEAESLHFEYLYEGTDDATQIDFKPLSVLPANFQIRSVGTLLTRSGARKYRNIFIKHAVRTGDITLGGAPQAMEDYTFNFDVNIENDGDFYIGEED